MAEVETVLEDEEATTEAYEEATVTLSKELQEIGKRMYEAEQAAGGAGMGGDGADGAPEDEYVDADVEDVDETDTD